MNVKELINKFKSMVEEPEVIKKEIKEERQPTIDYLIKKCYEQDAHFGKIRLDPYKEARSEMIAEIGKSINHLEEDDIEKIFELATEPRCGNCINFVSAKDEKGYLEHGCRLHIEYNYPNATGYVCVRAHTKAISFGNHLPNCCFIVKTGV